MDLSPRAERIAASALVAFSLALFILYSVVTPIFEASDELWHYPFVEHLAMGGGLPVQRSGQSDQDAPWRQEGSQPPLYYGVAALATAPIDQSDWRALRRLNVHSDMGVPTLDGNANAILHTPMERFPWSGATLAVHVARLVSALMSALTVLAAGLVAGELFPGRDRVQRTARVLAPIFTACVPMFAFISGSINNDNAAVMFCTLGVWWALRLLRTRALTVRNAMVAGLLTGAGALSKVSALGMLGLFGLSALLASIPAGSVSRAWGAGAAKAIARYGVVLTAVAAVVGGWWFARNQLLYGDVLGWNAFLDAVGRRVPPATLAQLWTEREGFTLAYWGVFGTLNVVMPDAVYAGLDAMTALACIGLAAALIARARRLPGASPLVWRQVVLCVGWLALIFLGFVRWTTLTPASQGRLLFPCIAVIGAAMAYGLGRVHVWLLRASAAAMLALAVAVPFGIIAPAYAVPRDAWASSLPVTLDADFGAQMTLAEASGPAAESHPGDTLEVALNWRITGTPARNYSVFVHAVDQYDVIVAQRDMHPGQGRLATSELAPGRAWTDRYALRLSAFSPAPRHIHFRVGVYDPQSGARLRLADGREWVDFGALDITPPAATTPLLRYAHGPRLDAYAFTPEVLQPGQTLVVTTTWSGPALPTDDYTLSLQLLDEQAQKIAQQDLSQPASAWGSAGERPVVTPLTVRPDAPAGVYTLLIVWYRPIEGFPRAGAYDGQGQYAGDQIQLARIRLR